MFEPALRRVEGQLGIGNALCATGFEHVFFTGSPACRRVIFSAAVKHLALSRRAGGKLSSGWWMPAPTGGRTEAQGCALVNAQARPASRPTTSACTAR